MRVVRGVDGGLLSSANGEIFTALLSDVTCP